MFVLIFIKILKVNIPVAIEMDSIWEKSILYDWERGRGPLYTPH